MKIDVLEVSPEDTILVTADVGNIIPTEVDAYCEKCLKALKETFGCDVTLIPTRCGGDWSFTLIKKIGFIDKSEKETEKV